MTDQYRGLSSFDINAEKAVLSAMMIDAEAIGTATAIIGEEDFFKNPHKIIFRTIAELYDEGKGADFISVIDRIDEKKLLDKAGGTDYISSLAEIVLSTSNLETHANIVKKHSDWRWIASENMQLQSYISDRKDEAPVLILNFMDECFKKGIIGGSGKDVKHISESLPHAMRVIEDRVMNKGKKLPGVATGFTDIDKILHGLRPGTLTLIAARPGMGKSAFAKDLVRNVAFSTEEPIYWGDYEMATIESIMRLTSASTHVSSTAITMGELDEQDIKKITDFYDALKLRNVFTNDNPKWDFKKVSAYLRKLKLQYGSLALAVFDYLQIMPRNQKKNTSEALSDLTMDMKNLAKELNFPIVALSQLNRGLESREDKRPNLGDLKASGGLEENSDNAIFIYRDEAYNPDTDYPNIAEILIKKHRNGMLGEPRLFYNKPTVGFYNLERIG